MSLLDDLTAARSASHDFWESTHARRAVDAIADALEARGVTTLYPVSPEGERVVGALLYARPGVFRVWTWHASAPPALIDGVTMSLIAAHQAARALKLAADPVVVVLEAPCFSTAHESPNVLRFPLSLHAADEDPTSA